MTEDGCSPLRFWNLFPDSPIQKIAVVITTLPTSTASLERCWSAAALILQDRERLTIDHLFEEMFIRWNWELIP